MKKLTQEAINRLSAQELVPSITLYMPTHKDASPPHIRESKTNFKNLSTEILSRSRSLSLPESMNQALDAIARQMENLYDDLKFWSNQTDGLALFAGPEIFECYNLPLTCDEYVAIDTRF